MTDNRSLHPDKNVAIRPFVPFVIEAKSVKKFLAKNDLYLWMKWQLITINLYREWCIMVQKKKAVSPNLDTIETLFCRWQQRAIVLNENWLLHEQARVSNCSNGAHVDGWCTCLMSERIQQKSADILLKENVLFAEKENILFAERPMCLWSPSPNSNAVVSRAVWQHDTQGSFPSRYGIAAFALVWDDDERSWVNKSQGYVGSNSGRTNSTGTLLLPSSTQFRHHHNYDICSECSGQTIIINMFAQHSQSWRNLRCPSVLRAGCVHCRFQKWISTTSSVQNNGQVKRYVWSFEQNCASECCFQVIPSKLQSPSKTRTKRLVCLEI